MADFALQLEGEGPTFDAWKEMGGFSRRKQPRRQPNKDTSEDINILPASPVVVDFAAKVLV